MSQVRKCPKVSMPNQQSCCQNVQLCRKPNRDNNDQTQKSPNANLPSWYCQQHIIQNVFMLFLGNVCVLRRWLNHAHLAAFYLTVNVIRRCNKFSLQKKFIACTMTLPEPLAEVLSLDCIPIVKKCRKNCVVLMIFFILLKIMKFPTHVIVLIYELI